MRERAGAKEVLAALNEMPGKTAWYYTKLLGQSTNYVLHNLLTKKIVKRYLRGGRKPRYHYLINWRYVNKVQRLYSLFKETGLL